LNFWLLLRLATLDRRCWSLSDIAAMNEDAPAQGLLVASWRA
jgi:hypothetical protein